MRQTSKQLFKFIIAIAAWTSSVHAASFVSDWKILIYMQADNDLASYAFMDLEEISSTLKNENRLRVFTHLDLPGDDGVREFEVLPSLSPAESVSKARVFSEFDGSQLERLEAFLIRAEELAPTKHTMIVIWGHGEGWSNGNTQFGGVAIDDNPASRLSMEEVRDAIKTRNALAGDKVQILAMDACLMQTIEVAYSFKDLAEFFVGSAQTQNFKGLPYDLVVEFIQTELSGLASNSASGEEYYLSKEIPNLFQKAYENSGEFDSETMSSLSGKELEEVFLPTFAKAMRGINAYLEKYPFAKFGLKANLAKTPFFLGNSRDIDTLLASLESYFVESEQSEIVEKIAEARATLASSVLGYVYGPNYFEGQDYYLGAFKAFGIWFPANRLEYVARIGDFEDSGLYSRVEFTPYQDFLRALFLADLF